MRPPNISLDAIRTTLQGGSSEEELLTELRSRHPPWESYSTVGWNTTRAICDCQLKSWAKTS